MSSLVLGSHNFLEAPTVNNDPIITSTANSIPNFSSGILSARPAAGIVGRLFLATDTSNVYRDNGASWDIEINGSTPVLKQNLSGTIPGISGTTIIPQDNTTPLVTEGTQVWTQLFTPSNAGSKVQIQTAMLADCGTNNRMVIASVFKDTTCIGVAEVSIATAARPQMLSLSFIDITPSLTPITYSCRVGVSSAATWYINRNATAFYNGMLALNTFTIQEF